MSHYSLAMVNVNRLTNFFDYISYIGIPLYIFMFIGWKIAKKTKFLSASEIDFSGARAFDILDEEEEFKIPIWKRVTQRFKKEKVIGLEK